MTIQDANCAVRAVSHNSLRHPLRAKILAILALTVCLLLLGTVVFRKYATEQLHAAIQTGDTQRALTWIRRGADVNSVDNSGLPVLSAAATRAKCGSIAQALLAAGANPNERARNGWCALTASAGTGDEPLVRAMLDHGADVNAVNGPLRETALMAAASHGNLATVKVLLDRDANPDAQRSDGVSALFSACSNHDRAVYKLIRSRTKKPVLMAAERADDPEMIAISIRQGADPNRFPSGDWSPLTEAVGGGHSKAVKALLRAKADPNRPDGGGRTPLDLAVTYPIIDSMKLLLDAGADPNHRGLTSGTPLAAALTAKDSAQRVALLLSHGARVPAAAPDGQPFLEAVHKMKLARETVRLLDAAWKRQRARGIAAPTEPTGPIQARSAGNGLSPPRP